MLERNQDIKVRLLLLFFQVFLSFDLQKVTSKSYTAARKNLICPFFRQGYDCCFCKQTPFLLTQLRRNQFCYIKRQEVLDLALGLSVCFFFSVYVFFPNTMQSAGPEIEDSFDFLFKIILVGDSNVGKTCVVQSFKSGIFMEKQQNTIGVDFTVRTLDIDGKKVKVGNVCPFSLISLVVLDHTLNYSHIC